NERCEAADRDNKLLWRRQPRRLEGEAIRDAMLAISGTLDQAMYGPGSLDDGQLRRSIYFTVKRSRLIPMMTLFDGPDSLQSLGPPQQPGAGAGRFLPGAAVSQRVCIHRVNRF